MQAWAPGQGRKVLAGCAGRAGTGQPVGAVSRQGSARSRLAWMIHSGPLAIRSAVRCQSPRARAPSRKGSWLGEDVTCGRGVGTAQQRQRRQAGEGAAATTLCRQPRCPARLLATKGGSPRVGCCRTGGQSTPGLGSGELTAGSRAWCTSPRSRHSPTIEIGKDAIGVAQAARRRREGGAGCGKAQRSLAEPYRPPCGLQKHVRDQ